MPFDGTKSRPMTRLEKLERLREHLGMATDWEQNSFCLCLYHRAAMDPELRAAGFTGHRVPNVLTIDRDIAIAQRFFGLSVEERLFTSDPVAEKKTALDALIAAERELTYPT